MAIHRSVTPERVAYLLQENEIYLTNDGLCIFCGETSPGVEGDAENYTCPVCGMETVFGLMHIMNVGLYHVVVEPIPGAGLDPNPEPPTTKTPFVIHPKVTEVKVRKMALKNETLVPTKGMCIGCGATAQRVGVKDEAQVCFKCNERTMYGTEALLVSRLYIETPPAPRLPTATPRPAPWVLPTDPLELDIAMVDAMADLDSILG